MNWTFFEVVILTGGEPGTAEAFNYFFSLVMNMMVILFVPIACLRLVWGSGDKE